MFSSLGLPTEQHTLPYKMLKLQLKQSKPFLNVTQLETNINNKYIMHIYNKNL